MSAPSGYSRLPDDVRCKCFNLWQEADGSLWCCGTGAVLEPRSIEQRVPLASPRARTATQDWVNALTIMQQSVLLGSIRGPDGIGKYHPVKYLVRWYRRCVLISAIDKAILNRPWLAGGGSFTGPSYDFEIEGASNWQARMDEQVSEYLRSTDELPHHFQLHFMHAVEIVGYKHPDGEIRGWWHKTYVRLVHDLHLFPENEQQLDRRLSDDEATWRGRADVATQA